MRYISMKMEAKGSRPPTTAMACGVRYHALSGMGLGMRLTLQHRAKSGGNVGELYQLGRAGGGRYHALSGMGLGMRFTLRMQGQRVPGQG